MTDGPAPDAITTPDQLDALPVGSVVLDRHHDAWQKHDDTELRDEDGERLHTAWASTAWDTDRTAVQMIEGTGRYGLRDNAAYDLLGPLTVLYGADAPARGSADAETLRDLIAERADLLTSNKTLRAEIERLREDLRLTTNEKDRYATLADNAEAECDAARTEAATLRTAIEALATEGEQWGQGVPMELARRLRAVLAAHPAPEAAPPTLTVTPEQVDAAWLAAWTERRDAASMPRRFARALGVTVVDAEADRG